MLATSLFETNSRQKFLVNDIDYEIGINQLLRKLIMALYKKMVAAWDKRDGQAYLDLHHDDFQMTWHSSGRVTKKEDNSAEQMKAIMERSKIRERRCIYENDEIIVQHMFADYENGTKDATMHVTLKKDGLLWRTETGVTSIKR